MGTPDSIADLQKRMAEAMNKDGKGPSPANASGDKKMSGDEEGHSWKQEKEEIEVYIPVEASLTKKEISIEYKKKALVMSAPHQIQIDLEQEIEPMGCGWTMAGGKVTVTLEKISPGYWSDIKKK